MADARIEELGGDERGPVAIPVTWWG